MARYNKADTIYLHIGTEKTGSSTLQAFGADNREALQERGVHYPRSRRGFKAHALLPFYASALTRPPVASRRHKIDGPEDLASFRADYAAELGKQARASGCRTVWLSNERLSAYLRRPQEIEKVANLMHSLANEAKVVVYLRDQADLYLSAYSTGVKGGSTADIRAPIRPGLPYFDYESMIDRWADAFGTQSILVRIFDRRHLVGGDVIDDFLAILGLHENGGFTRVPDQNKRLDARTIQFLRLFNRFVPRMDGDALNPRRGLIATVLADMSDGPRVSAPSETLAAIREAYGPSNARVARKYLGREDGVLFSPKEAEEEPSENLTVEEAVEIASKLWLWQQERYELRGGDANTDRDDGEAIG